MYEYTGTLVRVVDGDTCDMTLDVGFHLKATLRLRLLGINTPEKNDPNPVLRAKALEALAFLRLRLDGRTCIVKTSKADSFGRYLADIYVDGEHVNAELLAKGLAVPYLPGKPADWSDLE